MSALPYIDWDAAERVGVELVPAGPRVRRGEADQIVRELRAAARRATPIITEAAELPEAGPCRELVVDRAGVVRSNLATAQAMMSRFGIAERSNPLIAAAGTARGATIGSLLAILGTRILGQFDPFASEPTLILSAPTIMGVERQLQVVPADFRMWVALHEQTHRVQFANAPWLRELLLNELGTVVTAEDGDSFFEELAGRVAQLRADRAADRPVSLSLVQAMSSPESAAALQRVTAVMSLLEGHADLMMDRAGRQVIPSVRVIRAKFNQRRARGGLFGLVNKLLGMDAKLRQYSDGAEFCRQVVRRANLTMLNRAFAAPELLPSLNELLHPEKWLERVEKDGPA